MTWWTTRIAGHDVAPADPRIFSEAGIDREAADVVLAGNDGVGRRELVGPGLVREPARAERRSRGRALRRIAERHAFLDPTHERVDLLVGEAEVVPERVIHLARRIVEGAPRRHLASLDLLLRDLAHALHILVGHEREGRDATRAVAALALLLDERLDRLGKRERLAVLLGARRRRARRLEGGADRERKDGGGEGANVQHELPCRRSAVPSITGAARARAQFSPLVAHRSRAFASCLLARRPRDAV